MHNTDKGKEAHKMGKEIVNAKDGGKNGHIY